VLRKCAREHSSQNQTCHGKSCPARQSLQVLYEFCIGAGTIVAARVRFRHSRAARSLLFRKRRRIPRRNAKEGVSAMSIASMGGYGQMGNAQWPFLSPLEQIQTTGASDDGASCADASSSSTASSATGSSSTSSSVSPLSSEILALLIQLQTMSGTDGAGTSSTAATSSTSTTASATTTSAAGTSAASSTTANPIASLFSSIDTSGGSAISQSDFESYIENLGGTQSEADTLFAQLGGSASSGLSLSQLEQDAAQYGPPMGPPPPQVSASQMADGLVSAMGGSNGSVTQSEFENFVTANGGTTSEADQDFASLTQGSTSLTANDLEQAIQNQQQQASNSSSTGISLLSWLDSLSAASSGTPTA
jgi:hypothetical protein